MKRIIKIALALIVIALGIVAFVVINKQDDVPPQISFSDDSILVMDETSHDELLAGVKATDDVDGNVSDTLMIEKVTVSYDKTTATVVYVAKDKSNNIRKVEKEYEYLLDPNSVQLPQDTNYKVAIINNLGIENLASNWKLTLAKEGYDVTAVGLSDHEPAIETVIYVKKEGTGTELLEFFKNAKIVVEDVSARVNVPTKNADAFIVLGYQHSVAPNV